MGEKTAAITLESKEQARGIEQINTAMAEIDDVVQGIAAATEESATIADTLSMQAVEMKNCIEQLASVIGGEKTSGQGDGREQEMIIEKTESHVDDRTVEITTN